MMSKIKQGAAVIGSTLFIAVLLSACGNTASLFDQANEHTNQGMRYLANATQFSQVGDEDAADEALRLSESEFKEAAAKYEEILRAEPENSSAMINLGAAYYNLGQLERAIDQYRRALDLEPGDAGIHSNLAAALFQSGDLAEALREYQSAVELDPDLAEAQFGLGVVYLQLEQPDKAATAFERFQELDQGTDPIASQQAEQYLQRLGRQ